MTDAKNWLEANTGFFVAVVVLGEALASHLQYSDQAQLSATDLLSRYRQLAMDGACHQVVN